MVFSSWTSTVTNPFLYNFNVQFIPFKLAKYEKILLKLFFSLRNSSMLYILIKSLLRLYNTAEP